MHELSIAQEIFSIIRQSVTEEELISVKNVKVKVGKLSNILPDSLSFCYEALISDTPLKGSKLDILEFPVKIGCNTCNEESEIEPPVFACPKCGNNQIRIVSGTELLIEEIELFDEIPSVSALQSRDKPAYRNDSAGREEQ